MVFKNGQTLNFEVQHFYCSYFFSLKNNNVSLLFSSTDSYVKHQSGTPP